MNLLRLSATGVLVVTMSLTAGAQIKLNKNVLKSGSKVVKAVTLSDEEVIAYTREYIQWMDENNPVAPENDELAQRLKKLTSGLTTYDGLDLNFKVYLVKDVNAFACADGSVRVCAGLMDVMSDEEILGVIGHEIGHVKNTDSKDAFKTALLTSALKEGVASQGGAAATLSQSQLGELGEAVANSAFSRKQESKADDYGYKFLKDNEVNPWHMSMAFEKLLGDSGEAEGKKKGSQLFSSHPDTEKRIKAMSKKAEKDGFKRPE
ncbi:M48 family metallopeptidase [Sinomicrobium weinanense]|uniref:M48 family metallopeptidase n=1 Tax=Sinomicrobium weinanense TaxID=2842200 RepID=A0A926JUK4_9FLAO|nr:M48 family metallopeptidase [Sinomicrobium weinanense]MBC9797502.1 M48 family metallopeptidase [Sinomicrobium weinanense]MBU3122212.1 M48 family metallopeptidase [Sinomicrobium weinanense]